MRAQTVVKSQPGRACPPVGAVIAAVAGRSEYAVLDSAALGHRRGRFTIVAFDPIYAFHCQAADPDPFETLRDNLRHTCGQLLMPPDAPAAARVFPAGWIGYLAYEAGRFIEHLPATTRADVGLPLARFALYDTAAVHDARTGQWTLVAADLAGLDLGHRRETARPIADRLAEWQELLQYSQSHEVTPSTSPSMSSPTPHMSLPTHNMTLRQYEQMVERALRYIAAGDIYQVNLARRETYAMSEPAAATYLRLRRTNPAGYAAFLRWREPDVLVAVGEGVWHGRPARETTGETPVPQKSTAIDSKAGEAAILCSSPELFLQLTGRRVLTRPIKGTRPRLADPLLDRIERDALCTSEKDRAELAMIVDLERNDLGRVCEYGSIRVVCPPDSPAWPYVLESHPTVHHLVADVTGRLAPGRDAIDLVRACFPGGAITGAPKVRAMEIIDELEPTERSVYTGAIGYFSLAGSMTLNIAIRTLVVAAGRLHLYTGGGIVADSKPADEYRETQAKALGMHRALGQAGAEATLVSCKETR